MLEEPIRCKKGKLKAIDKPGLGIEIDKEMFEKNVIR
jgi:L-alanine-DL-glutamate epimerase-like enolase superfamily enzyme